MAKLVTIASGAAPRVYLDARPDSTVGSVVTVELIPGRQVFVPRGVCNGFQVTSAEDAEYLYFFDTEWQPGMTGVAVTPLDPAVAHLWPIPIDPDNREQISEKDFNAPLARHGSGRLEAATAQRAVAPFARHRLPITAPVTPAAERARCAIRRAATTIQS